MDYQQLIILPLAVSLIHCIVSSCFIRTINGRLNKLEQAIVGITNMPPVYTTAPPPPQYYTPQPPPGYGYQYYPGNPNNGNPNNLNVV